MIQNGEVMLGNQIIDLTESELDAPVTSVDTSVGYF